MGAKKKAAAEKRKELRRNQCGAILRNCPISARKMRLVVDLIRGREVTEALAILKNCKKDAAYNIHKLLMSAIANWQQKNEETPLEDVTLFIQTIQVGEGKMVKRIKQAAQGRAHLIRKRSNHVRLELGWEK